MDNKCVPLVYMTDVEVVFYEITYYIQTNYPKLMCIVNYFEKTYLGSKIEYLFTVASMFGHDI